MFARATSSELASRARTRNGQIAAAAASALSLMTGLLALLGCCCYHVTHFDKQESVRPIAHEHHVIPASVVSVTWKKVQTS